MLKHFATYCLALLTVLTYAQTADTFKISGSITSANSGEPIPDGTIMISKTKGYKCDSLGNFTISSVPQGQHRLSFSAFGYDNKDTVFTISNYDISNFFWTISTNCGEYSRERALKDIQFKKSQILLQGGIAPVVYTTDKNFEKTYKISFNDFGCVAGDRKECLIAYNRTIFEYLDKTFGKKWREEIRKDVIGL